MKIGNRLFELCKRNTDSDYINRKLYRLLYSENLYLMAYENIKSNKGILTKGTTPLTMDGISRARITRLINSLKDETYQPKPCRRVMIPKANGKLRPLGLPDADDKLVQEAIKMILECIYDSPQGATFSKDSFGFRTNLGGTPQGGIISPILANIYLHEFDMYVQKLQQEKGTEMIPSLEYGRYASLKHHYKVRLRKYPPGDERRKEIKQKMRVLQQQQWNIPSRVLKDPSKGHISYVRYADDWMIAIKGSKSYANEIMELCQRFYEERLKLVWNQEKSKLIRTTDEDTEFLGVLLHFRRRNQTKYVNFVIRGVKSQKRSVRINDLVLNVPKHMVLKRLVNKGFLKISNGEYKPVNMTKFVSMSDYEIVSRYNSIVRGIVNYYSFCNNPNELAHIRHLMHMSLICTLGDRRNICRTKVWKKYGKKTTVTTGDGKRTISYEPAKDFKRRPMNFRSKFLKRDIAAEFLLWSIRSKSLLRDYGCAICGTLKHIRKSGVTYNGFDRVMRYINRKQIPVCRNCHDDIHQHKHDDKSLEELANHIALSMGIRKPKR